MRQPPQVIHYALQTHTRHLNIWKLSIWPSTAYISDINDACTQTKYRGACFLSMRYYSALYGIFVCLELHDEEGWASIWAWACFRMDTVSGTEAAIISAFILYLSIHQYGGWDQHRKFQPLPNPGGQVHTDDCLMWETHGLMWLTVRYNPRGRQICDHLFSFIYLFIYLFAGDTRTCTGIIYHAILPLICVFV